MRILRSTKPGQSIGMAHQTTIRARVRKSGLGLFFVLLVSMLTVSNLHAEQMIKSYNLHANDLITALLQFAEQSDLVFVVPRKMVPDKGDFSLIGRMPVNEALALLLKGTSLAGEITRDGVLVIKEINDETGGSMNQTSTFREKANESSASHKRTNKSIFRSVITGLAAVMVGGQPVSAEAQSGEPEMAIEEITVTAQKRSQSIQDVPISIQAFNSDSIRELQLLRADEISRYVPNLTTTSTLGDTQMIYTIRGIGAQDFQTTTLNSVGIYLDDVSLQSPISSAFALLDMERIEVLRGPQNTLFGRNTTGGAINFVARKPDLDNDNLHGFLQAGFGRFEQIDIEGALGFKLGSNTAARISAVTNRRGAWQSNPILGRDVFDTERYTGRVQILSQPSDTLEIRAEAHYGVNRGEDRSGKSLGLRDPANPGPDFLGGAPCSVPNDSVVLGDPCANFFGFVDSDDPSEVTTNIPLVNDIDSFGLSLSVIKEFENFRLKSITSYESNELSRAADDDNIAQDVIALYAHVNQEQFSQEFQFSGDVGDYLHWIAGFLYFYEDGSHWDIDRIGLFNAGVRSNLEQKNDVYSAYGQFDYNFTDKLTFTAGLRYTYDDKDGHVVGSLLNITTTPVSQFLTPANTTPLVIATISDTPVEDETEEWGGKIGLQYSFNEHVMWYASAARGFKTSAFTVSALQTVFAPTVANVPARTEILTTYETGVKSTLANGRLQLNVAAFFNSWDDQQVFSVTLEPGIGPITQLINVPESESYGVEIDALWVPAEGWLVQAGLGLLESEIIDGSGVSNVMDGFELGTSPNVNFTGLVRKEWAVGNGLASIQFDAVHVGDYIFQVDQGPGSREPSNTTYNARASYTFGENDRYEIALWGKNLTDESFCTQRFPVDAFSGNAVCYPADPVTYGASIRLNFE